MAGTWAAAAQMGTGRHGLAAVAIGDSIYAFGGRANNNYLQTAEVLNTTTGDWRYVQSMQERRQHPQAVMLG